MAVSNQKRETPKGPEGPASGADP